MALEKKTSYSADQKEKFRRVLRRREFHSSEEDTPKKTRFLVKKRRFESESLTRVKRQLDAKADAMATDRAKRQRKPRVVADQPSTAPRPQVDDMDQWALESD
jgi:hypothetical protein